MNIIQALIKSFWYNKLGAKRRLPKEARNGNNKRLRKLRFLPPEMIEAIMNGTQDPELNVKNTSDDKELVFKNKNVFFSLFKNESSRYFRSTIYVLNTNVGAFFILFTAVL